MDERNGTGRYDMEKKRLSLNEEDMLKQIWDGGIGDKQKGRRSARDIEGSQGGGIKAMEV